MTATNEPEGRYHQTPPPETSPDIWDEYCRRGYANAINLYIWKTLRRELGELLTPSPGGTVFDGGCGTGGTLRLIAEKTQPKKIVAADFSDEMLKKTAECAPKIEREYNIEVEVKKVDVTKPLPWGDQTFDKEIFNSVFPFLPAEKWEEVMRECYRTLKKGGYLYFSVFRPEVYSSTPSLVKSALRELLHNPVVMLQAMRAKPVFDRLNRYAKEQIKPYAGHKLPNLVRMVGFKDVTEVQIIGGWSIVRAKK